MTRVWNTDIKTDDAGTNVTEPPTPVITMEIVEAACEAFYGEFWRTMRSARQAEYRSYMAAALTAAVPTLMMQAWDEGYNAGETDRQFFERGRRLLGGGGPQFPNRAANPHDVGSEQ